MPIYNLIEYSDVEDIRRFVAMHRDEPALDNNNGIIGLTANNNNSISFNNRTNRTKKKWRHK